MRFVLLTIADAANRDGDNARPGMQAMIEGSLYSVGHVRRVVAQLVEEDWIEITERGGGPGHETEFRVLMGRQKDAHHENLSPGAESESRARVAQESRTQTRDIAEASPLLGITDTETSDSSELDMVTRIFNAWLKSTGRTSKTRLDAKRRKLIESALKNYPPEDVAAAVRGWKFSAYHRGENSSGTVYNDLELLLRDASHIERFREFYRIGHVNGHGVSVAAPTQTAAYMNGDGVQSLPRGMQMLPDGRIRLRDGTVVDEMPVWKPGDPL